MVLVNAARDRARLEDAVSTLETQLRNERAVNTIRCGNDFGREVKLRGSDCTSLRWTRARDFPSILPRHHVPLLQGQGGDGTRKHGV